MALKADGKVVGSSEHPQYKVPSGLRKIKAVACGLHCDFALKDNGEVVTWGPGDNNHPPEDLKNAAVLAPGQAYYMALTEDGTVVPWGGIHIRRESVAPPEYLTGVDLLTAGIGDFYVKKKDGEILGLAARRSGHARSSR